MTPVPLAIGWSLWRRHRWELMLIPAYVIAASVAAAVLRAHLTPPFAGMTGFLLTMPVLWAAVVLIFIFSYGYEADLLSRYSGFPPGQFTLPVSTGALAGWPIVYGAAAVALLWLAAATFILQPSVGLLNVVVPLWWPAALAMTTLAWVQAALWSSFGLPIFRVILAVTVIGGVVALAQIASLSGAPGGLLAGLFVCVAAVGWRVAYVGVRRGRYGDTPDWDWLVQPLRRLAHRLPRRPQPFPSAFEGQVWFEWRRTGRALPLMTALVLPFALLPLLWGQNDVLPLWRTLLGAAAAPVVLAGMAGTVVSGKNPWVKDYYGVAPSTATLPMTTAGLVGAKLKAAALSALVSWTIVIGITSLAVVLTGNFDEVAGWWQDTVDKRPENVATILAAGILLFVWTWKRIVDSLLNGLTGRKWVIQGAVLLTMAGFLLLCFLGAWIYQHPQTHATFIAALPWLLGLLVLARLLATGWALRRLLQRQLLAPQTVLRWLAAWLLLATTLVGILTWSVPAELMPRQYLALAVVSVLPMTHLAATPLALAWNRHR